jgi:hypothetical protein
LLQLREKRMELALPVILAIALAWGAYSLYDALREE